jgi:integrase
LALKRTRYQNVFRRPSRRGKKHDTFTAAIYDPAAPGGKRWLGTFSSAEEARDAKLKAERKRTGRRRGPRRRLRVRDFAETWVERYPRPASTTNRTNRFAIRPFVQTFGDRWLDSLDRTECRDWALRAKYGQVKPTRSMLNDAIKEGLLEENPLAALGLPKPQGRANDTPPPLEVALAIAETAESALGPVIGPTFRTFIEFAIGSLMRPAELCVLQWDDIEFEKKTISVKRSIRPGSELALPKNQKEREIALTPLAERSLARLVPHPGIPWVFVNQDLKHFQKTTLWRYWDITRKAYAEKAKRPDLRTLHFYFATKHVGASWMLNELEISQDDLSTQLGHSSADLVALYAHPAAGPAIRRILERHQAASQTCHGDMEASPETPTSE